MGYYDDARDAIDVRFHAQWNSSDAKIVHENTSDTVPNGKPWVRLTVLPGQAPTNTLGPVPFYRHSGLIAIQIFTPPGDGTGRAYRLAEQAANIFRGVFFSGVQCRGAHATYVGLISDWFQLNVDIEFYYDAQAA